MGCAEATASPSFSLQFLFSLTKHVRELLFVEETSVLPEWEGSTHAFPATKQPIITFPIGLDSLWHGLRGVFIVVQLWRVEQHIVFFLFSFFFFFLKNGCQSNWMTLVSDFFFSMCDYWFWKQEGFLFIHFFQVCVSRKKSSVSLCVSLFVCCSVILRLWGSLVQCRVTIVTWRHHPRVLQWKQSRNTCECAFVSVPSSETWEFEHVILMSDCCFYWHFLHCWGVVVFLLEFILYSEHPAGGAGRWFSNEARRWRMFSRRCLMEEIERKN